MNNKGNLAVRLLFYIIGLVIMTFGVAISVRADLGVSPISSIPYTITCVTGMDLGVATIIFSIVMVLFQMVLLRKDYKLYNLLQVPASFLFGMFLTFCCSLAVYIPAPSTLLMQVAMTLISTVVVAIGVFLYVPAGIIPLPPDGAMVAIARVTKKKFANVKLASDISMVVISFVTCLAVLGELGSVGLGTILAAVLIGNEIKWMTRIFGAARDRMLAGNEVQPEIAMDTPLLSMMKKEVYTLSEEDSLMEALKLFREKKISGAPIVDAQKQLVGFISDGDIIRHLSAEHSLFVHDDHLEKIEFNQALRELVQKNVASINTRRIITVNAGDTLDEVCYKLGEHRIKKAPVMKDGEMIGIINVSNIIKYATDLMQAEA